MKYRIESIVGTILIKFQFILFKIQYGPYQFFVYQYFERLKEKLSKATATCDFQRLMMMIICGIGSHWATI